jgi:hypothetical protein
VVQDGWHLYQPQKQRKIANNLNQVIMKNMIFMTMCCFMAVASAEQTNTPLKQNTLYGNLDGMKFVGYDNKVPVFYDYRSTDLDDKRLFMLQRKGADSVFLKKYRNSRFQIWNHNIRLLWVNNDIEIYTMQKKDAGGYSVNANFIIVRGARVDTVFTTLNSFYQSGYEPFAITEDRETLFAVYPEGYQDEEWGWYYDSIMKIDLTKSPLVAEKLPITGTEIQRVGNYLYYKGGSGDVQTAILRTEIGKWTTVDTLAVYAGYWFVKDDILYVEIGSYGWQDEWLKGNRFTAYSLSQKRSAIVSKEKPPGDWYPIVFEGEYYHPWTYEIDKVQIPHITEFPYKQAFLPKKEDK